MTYEKLEEYRLILRKKYILCICFTICVIGITLLTEFYPAVVAGIVLSVIFSTFVTRKDRKNFSDAYKEYFVKRCLSEIFEDLEYEPDKGMPYKVIASTKMMNMGDIYRSNDYVSGKYKGINFSQADVHIEEEHEYTDADGDSHTSYVTIFMGKWMIFDFNKNFKSNVQVAQKGFGNNSVRKKTIFSSGKDSEYFKDVSMESESFNKRFRVFAQNELEAFYLLTPSLMEKIERLDDNNKGKLLLCFVDNRLHIGLYDNKDSFEAPSSFKKIDEQAEIEKTKGDILTITQFVDELSLDNDLFRREA